MSVPSSFGSFQIKEATKRYGYCSATTEWLTGPKSANQRPSSAELVVHVMDSDHKLRRPNQSPINPRSIPNVQVTEMFSFWLTCPVVASAL